MSAPTKPWAEMSMEERIAAVQPLTASGLSASEIAAKVGTTKKSICGMWARYADRFDRDPWAPRQGHAKPKRAKPAVKQKLSKPAPVVVVEPPPPEPAKAEPVAPPPPVIRPPRPRNVEIPKADGLTLLTAGPFHCRYVTAENHLGHGLAGPAICGDAVVIGTSWCAKHHAIVFTPENRRRLRMSSLVKGVPA